MALMDSLLSMSLLALGTANDAKNPQILKKEGDLLSQAHGGFGYNNCLLGVTAMYQPDLIKGELS